MAAELMEQQPVTEQATPPALSAERREQIRQALTAFTDFNAKNARTALKTLRDIGSEPEKTYADYWAYDARSKANNASHLAYKVIDAHEMLAQGKTTYAGNLEAYAPDETMRSWNRDNYNKIADPLEFNPLQETIRHLEEVQRKNAEDLKKLEETDADDVKRHGRSNDDGSLKATRESAERFARIIEDLESANLRYKGAFSDLKKALDDNGITPDELIRYNNEQKEKAIFEAVADFSKKDQAGTSKAEIAREAFKTFSSDRQNYSKISFSAGNGVDALDAMGQGAKANGEHLDHWNVSPSGLSGAVTSMEAIIKETAQSNPGKAQQLEDAKEAFVIATRDIMKSFEDNAVSPTDLKRYNAKLVQRDEKRQKDFNDLGSKDKIVQFVSENGGANLARYQAIIDGVDAVLNVRDEILGMERGNKVTVPEYISANTPFLNEVRNYYTNKKEGLKAVAEGRDLKPEEFQSLAEYPVVNVDWKVLDGGGVYTFKLEQKKPVLERGEMDRGIMPLVMDMLNAFDMQSAKPNIIKARKALSLMRINAYGHNEVNKESLVDVEKKHDIVPDKFHNLLADGHIEVAASPSVLNSDLLVTPAASGELDRLTATFVEKAAGGNSSLYNKIRELREGRERLGLSPTYEARTDSPATESKEVLR